MATRARFIGRTWDVGGEINCSRPDHAGRSDVRGLLKASIVPGTDHLDNSDGTSRCHGSRHSKKNEPPCLPDRASSFGSILLGT